MVWAASLGPIPGPALPPNLEPGDRATAAAGWRTAQTFKLRWSKSLPPRVPVYGGQALIAVTEGVQYRFE